PPSGHRPKAADRHRPKAVPRCGRGARGRRPSTNRVGGRLRTTLLRAEGLAAGYGDLLAVRSVSLDVEEGECVALIGANGAGKARPLRAISGLVPIRAGRVLFRGESLAGLSTRRVVERGLAHVPEGRQIFPTLSVRENLEMGARSPTARVERNTSF